jgi:hypothetical protein
MPKRCQHVNCGKQPTFGTELRKALYCAEHKIAGMADVISARCRHEGCGGKEARYGTERGRALYCIEHKTAGMENVTSKRCRHEYCGKRPTYGTEWGKALYCNEHKTTGMENVVDKRCRHEYCGKRPKYGTEWGKALYCNEHKTAGMDDVMNKRCKSHFCNTFVRGKFRGYCLRCFVYIFPDEPVSRNYRVKESSVREFIEPYLAKEFPHLTLTFDKAITGGCSTRRPDTFVDALTHCVFGEVDEEGHNTQAYCLCENKRMMGFMQDVGMRPCVHVRLNPDGYVDATGVRHKSPFKKTKTGKLVLADPAEWQKRLDLYRSRLEYHLTHVPEQELQVEHLFYDGFI